MAGVEGFEPPITDSESVVLPLDDTPLIKKTLKNSFYSKLTCLLSYYIYYE